MHFFIPQCFQRKVPVRPLTYTIPRATSINEVNSSLKRSVAGIGSCHSWWHMSVAMAKKNLGHLSLSLNLNERSRWSCKTLKWQKGNPSTLWGPNLRLVEFTLINFSFSWNGTCLFLCYHESVGNLWWLAFSVERNESFSFSRTLHKIFDHFVFHWLL